MKFIVVYIELKLINSVDLRRKGFSPFAKFRKFSSLSLFQRSISYLSVDVERICCCSIDFKLWLSILCDLPYKWHGRSNIFIFSTHFIHFEESYAVERTNHNLVIFLTEEMFLLNVDLPFPRINTNRSLLLKTFSRRRKVFVNDFLVLFFVFVLFFNVTRI